MQDDDAKKIQRNIDKTLKEIQKHLEEIETRYPLLSIEDAGFVRARESYLTDQQRRLFADVLVQPQADVQPSELDGLTYQELQARAKALGIKSAGVKHEELLRLVTEFINGE